MRFAYVGDHAETRTLGLVFRRGEPVHVRDDRAARKLAGNADFVRVADDPPPVPQPEPRARPQKRGA